MSENFEGFSQILNEQSGEKRYLGVFTLPIAINKKYENPLTLRKICLRGHAIFELCNRISARKQKSSRNRF